MAPKNTTPKIERPCANPACGHVHEGIPCMEDGCECKKSVPPAEVPRPQVDTRTDSEPAGATVEKPQMIAPIPLSLNGLLAEGDAAGTTPIYKGIPRASSLQSALPIQERIANLIEDFEAENGRFPIGCELIVSGRIFTWNGEQMVEVPAAPTPPPPTAPVALSEEDQAKVRELFAEQTPAKELPDGSLQVMVTISVDQAEILRAWAQGAQEPFNSYLQTILDVALNATINGGAVAG